MQCPACGYQEMDQKTVDKTLSYGGRSITLRRMKGEFCPKCGDGVWDVKSYRRFTKAQAKIVSAARSDASNDIRRIRKVLKLTQAKLAENLGLGKLAFSRYEQGKTQPPVALVKLLRLIEKHPGLLDELREIDVPLKRVPTLTGCRKQAAD